MLTSAAFGLYPYLLPSNGDPKLGLDIYNSSAAKCGWRKRVRRQGKLEMSGSDRDLSRTFHVQSFRADADRLR
jgi:hypothetical protein